jgi:hypothetical protein
MLRSMNTNITVTAICDAAKESDGHD